MSSNIRQEGRQNSSVSTAAPPPQLAIPPQDVFPGVEGHSITINGFSVSTRKRPILKAEPIEQMTESLGIAPPEMIFGDNFVSIEHQSSGFGITFNTYDALDKVDKTGKSMLQVAHSREWQNSRYDGAIVSGRTQDAKGKSAKRSTKESLKWSSHSIGHIVQIIKAL